MTPTGLYSRLLLVLPLLLAPVLLSAQEGAPTTTPVIDPHGLDGRVPRAMGASTGEAYGVLKPGALIARVDGGAISADHYYSPTGELKRFDTSGTAYTRIFVRPSVRYGLFKNVELSLTLPFTHEKLTSTERFPERSIGRLSSVDLGLGWSALNLSSAAEGKVTSRTSVAVRGQISVPTGFHNGIYDDPAHPSFIDDGALEGELGVAAVHLMPEMEIGARVGYRMRGEELEDEIPWSIGIDLTRIQGAAIGVGVFGVFSAVDASNPSRPFYAGSSGTAEQQTQIDGGQGILRRSERENYTSIRAGVTVDLGDTWSLGAHYAVRLAGTNSYGLSGAWMTLGFRMP